jgi:hypothetical protein
MVVEDLLKPVIPEPENLSIAAEESTALMMLPIEDSDFLNQPSMLMPSESSPLHPVLGNS